MKKRQYGFMSIELILSLAVLAVFFLMAAPKFLLTEKMQTDFQAQYLLSNLRLLQQKNFSLPHEAKAVPTPYMVLNKTSYELYFDPAAKPVVVNMPEGIVLSSNHGSVFSFNRGDKYTVNAATINISGKDSLAKVIIHSYGRIRMAK
ncbi:pilus assembly FimT family protein [Pectinatus haikarae]|uniref:Type II secretory pathway pseudopilin PulG n=1 Tax=Pectinatus haikarae TaxID=349096 RepID=A0ABT9Y8L3_9FIRM|nr:type II secretion system protein [Pectinatus haikarae]MDQ0204187.1 type II secretory pathway pseudopilin PulG [Pectinatus haikarae]